MKYALDAVLKYTVSSNVGNVSNSNKLSKSVCLTTVNFFHIKQKKIKKTIKEIKRVKKKSIIFSRNDTYIYTRIKRIKICLYLMVLILTFLTQSVTFNVFISSYYKNIDLGV